jgi:hypothetical protein
MMAKSSRLGFSRISSLTDSAEMYSCFLPALGRDMVEEMTKWGEGRAIKRR